MKRILSIVAVALLLVGFVSSCRTIQECPSIGQVETETPAVNS